eukprot:3961609-Pyramimonas_sp.AAC.1
MSRGFEFDFALPGWCKFASKGVQIRFARGCKFAYKGVHIRLQGGANSPPWRSPRGAAAAPARPPAPSQ